jgi:hypothetical protein
MDDSATFTIKPRFRVDIDHNLSNEARQPPPEAQSLAQNDPQIETIQPSALDVVSRTPNLVVDAYIRHPPLRTFILFIIRVSDMGSPNFALDCVSGTARTGASHSAHAMTALAAAGAIQAFVSPPGWRGAFPTYKGAPIRRLFPLISAPIQRIRLAMHHKWDGSAPVHSYLPNPPSAVPT